MKKILLMMLVSLSLCAITLDEALQKLQTSNLELQISKIGIEAKKLDTKMAKYSRLGKLDLSSSAMMSDDALNAFGFKLKSRIATFDDFGFNEFPTTNPPKNLNQPASQHIYTTSLDYMLPIFTGGKISSYQKMSQKLVEISKLKSRQLLSEKKYQLIKTFYDVKMLENLINDLEQMKSNIKKLEFSTQEMYKEGYAKKIDIQEVQTKEQGVLRMINEMKINKELSLDFISFLLNSDIDSVDTSSLGDISYDENSTDTLIDVEIANKNIELLNQKSKLDRAGYLPEIGFFANFSSSSDEVFKDFEENRAYIAGVQIKINLFDGLSTKYKSQKTKKQLLQSKLALELTKKGKALEVSKLTKEIKKFDFYLASLKKSLDFASAIYENYQIRYQESLTSINDLLIKHSEKLEKIMLFREAENKRLEKILLLKKLKATL